MIDEFLKIEWCARVGRGSVVASALILLGCAVPAGDEVTESEIQLPPVDTTVQRESPPGASRPERVEGQILIEGMSEPMLYLLYQTPEEFPLPFSTYLPEDFAATTEASGEGDAVRFIPRFGGSPVEDAWFSLHVPAEDLNAAAAQQLVREVAESLGEAERVEGGGYTWALEEYMFHGQSIGRVALGRHGGRYFYLVSHYPAEMGDGMAPRTAHILSEWRWAGGGRLGS